MVMAGRALSEDSRLSDSTALAAHAKCPVTVEISDEAEMVRNDIAYRSGRQAMGKGGEWHSRQFDSWWGERTTNPVDSSTSPRLESSPVAVFATGHTLYVHPILRSTYASHSD
ncbi:hypothetical protein CSUB01_04935 [Colletotrichum sublineola]|uniref:Uncharacterized protein n=1 Tax=Colletotrichum sublineola TaxID=1173701 RepID=A0A066XKA6_COLSU|nr:hypothetical protein CSUB01_04935 [Colletotrichum sublineola]